MSVNNSEIKIKVGILGDSGDYMTRFVDTNAVRNGNYRIQLQKVLDDSEEFEGLQVRKVFDDSEEEFEGIDACLLFFSFAEKESYQKLYSYYDQAIKHTKNIVVVGMDLDEDEEFYEEPLTIGVEKNIGFTILGLCSDLLPLDFVIFNMTGKVYGIHDDADILYVDFHKRICSLCTLYQPGMVDFFGEDEEDEEDGEDEDD